MIVAVTGASGFIGSHLVTRLLREGHSVRAIGRRDPGVDGTEFAPWEAGTEPPEDAFKNADAVVHLAGEPVAQRWTSEAKQRIRDSRVTGTRNLVAALAKLERRPKTLVSASAVGYYGNRGDEILTESSAPGNDFLANICIGWEHEARNAGPLGMRVVLLRTGIALGPDGGALKQMLGPFKAGVGGPAGSGKQWVSWIHLEDAVSLILFCLSRHELYGAVNATAPEPVRNGDFAHALGHALHRPSRLAAPAFALKLMFGEMAEAISGSQRVVPEAAQRAGFRFQFPEIQGALSQILA